MTQQYFVSVRTMGPYNANNSTKEVCSVITRKLNNTIVPSLGSIDKVREYVRTMCDTIQSRYPKNKKLNVETWDVGMEIPNSRHIVVRIDGHSSGDGAFFQIDFTPVRHKYYDDNLMADLMGVSDFTLSHEAKRPALRRWNPDNASFGDIICDDEADEIIIYRRIRSNYIVYAAVYSQGDGFFNVQDNDTLTYGYVGRKTFHYATKEEKGILFNELSIRGLRWNEETLQIEKIED